MDTIPEQLHDHSQTHQDQGIYQKEISLDALSLGSGEQPLSVDDFLHGMKLSEEDAYEAENWKNSGSHFTGNSSLNTHYTPDNLPNSAIPALPDSNLARANSWDSEYGSHVTGYPTLSHLKVSSTDYSFPQRSQNAFFPFHNELATSTLYDTYTPSAYLSGHTEFINGNLHNLAHSSCNEFFNFEKALIKKRSFHNGFTFPELDLGFETLCSVEVRFPQKQRQRAQSLALPIHDDFSSIFNTHKRRSVSGTSRAEMKSTFNVAPAATLVRNRSNSKAKITKPKRRESKSMDNIEVSGVPPPTGDPTPREQQLRSDYDRYTPRLVRYEGVQKQGFCDLCEPGKWMQLKNSAFWYHKQFIHGISSADGRPFATPSDTRLVWISETVAGKIGLVLITEGLCSCCNLWVELAKHKKFHSQTYSGGLQDVVNNIDPSFESDVLSFSPLKIMIGVDYTGHPTNPIGIALEKEAYDELISESLNIRWFRHAFKCAKDEG